MVTDLTSSSTLTDTWNTTLAQEPEWQPFLSYAWQKLWEPQRETGWEPLFLHVDLGVGVIAPFERRNDTVRFSGGVEISDYMDLIGNPAHKIQAWEQILLHLSSLGVHTLELHNVPETSPTYLHFIDSMKKEDTTPRFALPQTWDAYLAQLSKNKRHEIRRKFRRFDEMFNDIAVTRVANLSEGIETLLELMKLNPAKRAFLTPTMETFFRAIPTAFPQQTLLYELTVEGNTAASVLGFSSKKTLYLYNSGFNEPKYPSSGFYLAASTIRESILAGLTEYNFLQGDERYKYDLGAQDAFVYSAHITLP